LLVRCSRPIAGFPGHSNGFAALMAGGGRCGQEGQAATETTQLRHQNRRRYRRPQAGAPSPTNPCTSRARGRQKGGKIARKPCWPLLDEGGATTLGGSTHRIALAFTLHITQRQVGYGCRHPPSHPTLAASTKRSISHIRSGLDCHPSQPATFTCPGTQQTAASRVSLFGLRN